MTLFDIPAPVIQDEQERDIGGRFSADPFELEPATGRRRFRVSGLVALLAGLIVFGVFAVTPDGTGLVQSGDSRLAAVLHVAGWHRTALVDALGSPSAILIGSLIACVVVWERSGRCQRHVQPIVVTGAAAIAAWIPAAVIRRPSPGRLGDLSAANATSFPSIAAAMLTTATLTTLACAGVRMNPRARRTTIAVAILVPTMTRLMTASSWPFDEIAGVLVGCLVARAANSAQYGAPRGVRRRRSHSRQFAAIVTVALAALLVPMCRSYFILLTAPGNAAVDQRTIEWLREGGLSPLVDRGESWWLWRHLPSPTATIHSLAPPPVRAAVLTQRSSQLPPSIRSALTPSLPGEGVWTIAAADPMGRPQIATSIFRPDVTHPSLVAGVAWMNSALTRFTLIAGTRQPGGGVGPAGGHVPTSLRDSLLAAFNSGYKMNDTPGGSLIEGHATKSMIDGIATFAVRADGTATVGEWGTDLTADQAYVGLRQNLHLVVVDGVAVSGLATNAGGRWGTVRNTLPTWRSGLGVTAKGDLLYVAGNNLTLAVLGDSLVRAGAVTAMELDIHRGMVTFNLFTQQPSLKGHNLLPNMTSSADRYLSTDWRDFIMVTSR